MSNLIKAIRNLKPNAEFSITNDDYSTINWDILEGDAPTLKQIKDEIKKVEADELIAGQIQATARASALAKLAALGLSAEEIAAL